MFDFADGVQQPVAHRSISHSLVRSQRHEQVSHTRYGPIRIEIHIVASKVDSKCRETGSPPFLILDMPCSSNKAIDRSSIRKIVSTSYEEQRCLNASCRELGCRLIFGTQPALVTG